MRLTLNSKEIGFLEEKKIREQKLVSVLRILQAFGCVFAKTLTRNSFCFNTSLRKCVALNAMFLTF